MVKLARWRTPMTASKCWKFLAGCLSLWWIFVFQVWDQQNALVVMTVAVVAEGSLALELGQNKPRWLAFRLMDVHRERSLKMMEWRWQSIFTLFSLLYMLLAQHWLPLLNTSLASVGNVFLNSTLHCVRVNHSKLACSTELCWPLSCFY